MLKGKHGSLFIQDMSLLVIFDIGHHVVSLSLQVMSGVQRQFKTYMTVVVKPQMAIRTTQPLIFYPAIGWGRGSKKEKGKNLMGGDKNSLIRHQRNIITIKRICKTINAQYNCSPPAPSIARAVVFVPQPTPVYILIMTSYGKKYPLASMAQLS